ncbi:hypothetical protein [Asticcacaulis sp. YBE204]|uniref:hypothetical protein n=1 Tax=Asticcacaulis sp. YBE204 TaxID=1282363 RepID=UPI0003FE3076|nr:hypothetical protein [Asticcacaulis sp. YBE204]
MTISINGTSSFTDAFGETPDIPPGFPEDQPIELPPHEPKEGDVRPSAESPSLYMLQLLPPLDPSIADPAIR